MVVCAVVLIVSVWLPSLNARSSVEQTLARLEAAMPAETSGQVGEDPAASLDAQGHPVMSALQIDDESYIGIIRIPSLDLALPVQSGWSEAALEKTPCRYMGSILDGSLIIVGGDYPDQFGQLENLRVGDEVTFSDANGRAYGCRVTRIDNPTEVDSSYLVSGDWDLSIYAYLDSIDRYVVARCSLA